MELSVQLTERDFVAAQKLHFRPKPAVRWAAYLLGALLVGVLLQEVLAMAQGRPLPRSWWVLPAGLGYGAFLFFILLPWRIGRIFRQNPALAVPTRVTFSDDGFSLDSTRGELRFGWKSLSRWKRNRDTILAYHSGNHFHTFPRHCFSSDEEFQSLATLLAKHVGPAAL